MLLCQTHAAPMQSFMAFDAIDTSNDMPFAACSENVNHLQAETFCATCNKLLCASCILNHTSHEWKKIVDIKQQWKQELESKHVGLKKIVGTGTSITVTQIIIQLQQVSVSLVVIISRKMANFAWKETHTLQSCTIRFVKCMQIG